MNEEYLKYVLEKCDSVIPELEMIQKSKDKPLNLKIPALKANIGLLELKLEINKLLNK